MATNLRYAPCVFKINVQSCGLFNFYTIVFYSITHLSTHRFNITLVFLKLMKAII